ncbi:uncharacterized protein RCH25_015575 [Pelodytes ibericus]
MIYLQGVYIKKMRILLFLPALLPLILAKGDDPDQDMEAFEPALRGNRKFAISIFQTVCNMKPTANVFMSPLSISLAFSMLSNGAKSTTRDEIINGLCLNKTENIAEINKAFRHLLKAILAPCSEPKVDIGSPLFIDQSLKLLKSFKAIMRNNYFADFKQVDFEEPTTAIKEINDYVNDKTEGKIPNLLDRLGGQTVLVLVNYVFFKAKWEHPFSDRLTMPGQFSLDKSSTITVPMMRRQGMYKVHRDRELNCQILQIPYSSTVDQPRTSMFIVVPELGYMDNVVNTLSAGKGENWKAEVATSVLEIHIPKFEISTELNLVDILENMGITKVFTKTADLSGIAGTNNLYVSSALHKATLTVNENGTEAVAATAIEVSPELAPTQFKVDKPFLLVIYNSVIKSTTNRFCTQVPVRLSASFTEFPEPINEEGVYGKKMRILLLLFTLIPLILASGYDDDEEIENIGQANLKFAINILQAVCCMKQRENVFFSPLSVSMALAMLSNGAESDTRKQLLEGLCFNETQTDQEINEAFHHFLQELNTPNAGLKVDMGNGLFIDQRMDLQKRFQEIMTNHYYADFKQVDFSTLDAALREINNYVKDKTNGKIPKLLNSLDPTTVLVMVNYVFFKAKWEEPFNEKLTAPGQFSLDASSTVTVPMMQQLGYYKVYHDREQGCEILQMQYQTSNEKAKTSMYIVVPPLGKIDEIIKVLTAEKMEEWRDQVSTSILEISIPKLEISTELDLAKVLKSMGVTNVFSTRADLSGISETDNLYVSKAVHKATITVNENGTEATSATAIAVSIRSRVTPFQADRPFILVVYNELIESIIFIGRIMDPTK